MNPETLRTYALIFESPWRDPITKRMQTPTSINLTMAQCARMVADAIERDDPYLPPGWRDMKPTTKEST